MPERGLAVITGASSGIGAAFARKLAARNYDLLLVARREDRLRSLATELAESYKITADVMVADLARDDDCERAAERILNEPRLELLINNAGFGRMGLFVESDIDLEDRMHRLHVLATLRLSHAALVNLVPRGIGGIINVSSIAAFNQAPSSVSYCATKAWMNSFTEGLAVELGVRQSPVRVQALCPGFTFSEFHDRMRMQRSTIPSGWWMTPDFVVEQSSKASTSASCL